MDVGDVYMYAKDPEWAGFLLKTVPKPYVRRSTEELTGRPTLAPTDPTASWATALDGVGVASKDLCIDSLRSRFRDGARRHGGGLAIPVTSTGKDFAPLTPPTTGLGGLPPTVRNMTMVMTMVG